MRCPQCGSEEALALFTSVECPACDGPADEYPDYDGRMAVAVYGDRYPVLGTVVAYDPRPCAAIDPVVVDEIGRIIQCRCVYPEGESEGESALDEEAVEVVK